MKVLWICPHGEHDGIARYSAQCIAALRLKCRVEEFDAAEAARFPARAARAAAACACVHIQYESMFFLVNGRDRYPALCRALARPKAVTLHEIYAQYPYAFPRSAITGPLAPVRRFLYDRRHPYLTALRRHARAGFYAEQVLVHHRYQRGICTTMGTHAARVGRITFPHAVFAGRNKSLTNPGTLYLAANGFFNPGYDYAFLVDVLRRIRQPWHFTWIGGTRRPEDRGIEEGFMSLVDNAGIADKVTVTGWVDDAARDALLGQADLVCAFFSHRSTSASLATMLVHGAPVIALRSELIVELVADGAPITMVERDAAAVVHAMEMLAAPQEQARIAAQAQTYCESHSVYVTANEMAAVYDGLLAAERNQC